MLYNFSNTWQELYNHFTLLISFIDPLRLETWMHAWKFHTHVPFVETFLALQYDKLFYQDPPGNKKDYQE